MQVEGKLQSDVAVYKHAARLFEQQAGLVAPGAGEGAPTPKTAPETRLTAGSKRGGGRRCKLPRRAAKAIAVAMGMPMASGKTPYNPPHARSCLCSHVFLYSSR